MYGAPILAISVAAVVLLGPGRSGPALGVRVWGGPALGARCTAFRLEALRRYYGVDDRISLAGLSLELRDIKSGSSAIWSGSTGDDGIADARLCLDKPLGDRAELLISRKQEQIAQGSIALADSSARVLPSLPLSGIVRGELEIQVKSPRGIWIAPFEDTLWIELVKGAKGRSEIWLSASAQGAELQQKRLIFPVDRALSLKLKPTSHLVELSLSAEVDGVEQGVWEGVVPVVPGGIWLEPQRAADAEGAKQIRLFSPSPRKNAYVSLLSEQGRHFGATVPLSQNAEGFFVGEFGIDLGERGEQALQTAVLVAAGDPAEQGSATVAWPLRPAVGKAIYPKLELLLDGLPQAEKTEQERAISSRRTAVLLIAALAVFEILFFFAQSRKDRRALEMQLEKASEADDSRIAAEDGPPRVDRVDRAGAKPFLNTESWLWGLVAVALIGLGFALVAALALFR